ncbi:MAG TPA: hypothetical protein DEP76_08140 [Alteromonas sp.]|nr:hypothetical protein [Alteromonas sp.]|tara:strand:- start:6810 stop:8654 length:1845 start_codon:yes stop_codon:yes gene_type:complete
MKKRKIVHKDVLKTAVMSLIVSAGLTGCGSDKSDDNPPAVAPPVNNPPAADYQPLNEFSIGNAVAPINSWMTAWTLNDLIKTTGFENDETSADAVSWQYTIDGNWYMGDAGQIVTDESGWPTQMMLRNGTRPTSFVTIVLGADIANAYAPGEYHLSYEGQGNLAITNAEITAQSDGAMTLLYDGDGSIFIEITDTDPDGTGNHLRNIQLLRPDSLPSERFHADYLNYVTPFSTIRPLHMSGEEPVYAFPDADGGYSYYQGAGAWDRRKQISDAGWGGAMGAPYEVMVDLANQTDSDLWLNLPLAADDDYLSQLATLILAELDEDRQLIIELGNELWNWSYPYAFGRSYAFEAAQQRWPGLLGTTPPYMQNPIDENTMIFSWQAARTIEAARVFKQTWGDEQNRIKVILAGQFGASTPEWDLNRLILEAPVYVNEESATIPALEVDALAVGAYVNDPYQEGATILPGGFDRSSPEAFITDAISYVNGVNQFTERAEEPGMRFAVRSDVALAAEYSLPLVAYEGGHHFIGSRFTRDEVVPHELMYEVYQALFTMWQEEGAGLFVHLHGILPRGQNEDGQEPGFFESENFGIKETQQQTESEAPRYRAVMDVIRSLE